MGQQRRLGRVPEVHPDVATLYASPQSREPIHIERLGERVVNGLADHGVIGYLDGARHVLLTGGCTGEQRSHQVVGLHSLDRRRVLLAAPEAQDDQ